MCVKPRESIFLAVLLVGSASGATLRVPTDFSTIQSAIDAAGHGDEIVVAPGNYQERIDYAGKEIRLRSSAGPHLTIIDGSGETVGTTVLIAPQVGPNALLQGFTITGDVLFVCKSFFELFIDRLLGYFTALCLLLAFTLRRL